MQHGGKSGSVNNSGGSTGEGNDEKYSQLVVYADCSRKLLSTKERRSLLSKSSSGPVLPFLAITDSQHCQHCSVRVCITARNRVIRHTGSKNWL